MTPIATIALLGFPLVVMLLFMTLSPRRAVIAAFVIGVMYLPFTAIVIPGFPNYTKTTAISIGCFAGVMLFDAGTLLRYRFHWLDLTIVVGVVGYAWSSVGNGLGAYEAFSVSIDYLLQYGIPYFLGRLYLGTPGALKDVAVGLVIGFVSYIPIMVFEFRMSAQLAHWIYNAPSAAHRMGFLFLRQPAGFFLGPLPLSTYLGPLAALAVWLAIGRSWRGWWVLSAWGVAGLACLFTFLAFGRGSLVIMTLGAGAAFAWRYTRSNWIPQTFAALTIAYLATALLGSAVDLRLKAVEIAGILFGADKAGSLWVRLSHEQVLVEHAWKSPLYGWGGWGRHRMVGAELMSQLNTVNLVTDGLWVIIFAQRGLLGLFSIWGWMILPGMLAVRHLGRLPMALPQQAVVLGLTCWSFLYSLDCLMNAFWTPVQPLVAGGLASFCMLAARYQRSSRSSPQSRMAASTPASQLRPAELPLVGAAGS